MDKPKASERVIRRICALVDEDPTLNRAVMDEVTKQNGSGDKSKSAALVLAASCERLAQRIRKNPELTEDVPTQGQYL